MYWKLRPRQHYHNLLHPMLRLEPRSSSALWHPNVQSLFDKFARPEVRRPKGVLDHQSIVLLFYSYSYSRRRVYPPPLPLLPGRLALVNIPCNTPAIPLFPNYLTNFCTVLPLYIKQRFIANSKYEIKFHLVGEHITSALLWCVLLF